MQQLITRTGMTADDADGNADGDTVVDADTDSFVECRLYYFLTQDINAPYTK